MCGLSLRHGLGRGSRSHERTPVVGCRFRCRLLLAEIPKGVNRNSELKQRLQLWESGQISDLICKVLGQPEQQEECSHRQTNSAGSEPVL